MFTVTPKYDSNLTAYLMRYDFEETLMADRIRMVKMILNGITVKGCYHMDIKPSNIYLNKDVNGKWNGQLVIVRVKIAYLILIY